MKLVWIASFRTKVSHCLISKCQTLNHFTVYDVFQIVNIFLLRIIPNSICVRSRRQITNYSFLSCSLFFLPIKLDSLTSRSHTDMLRRWSINTHPIPDMSQRLNWYGIELCVCLCFLLLFFLSCLYYLWGFSSSV